jgi:hypothetical protein
MAPGFTIAEVRFRGKGVEDAVVTFAPGLCVVAGPSNTGKSLIRAAINFVFGSSQPMKTVKEGAAYQTIFVEVRTSEGTAVTFERAWQGGDIKQYHTAASDVAASTPSTVLSAQHSAESQGNISVVLLVLAGFTGIKLRKKQTGDLRNLSFRDFVEYVLISEERIITELSPIHTGNPIGKTFESSLFRALLTGKDDANIIAVPSTKDEKQRIAGQEEAIERIKDDILSRIPKDGRTEEDLLQMAATIDARVTEQSRLLQNYRTDLTNLEQQRREIEQEHQRTLARFTQVGGNLKRFDLLNQQYDSDLKRLQSTVEAGSLFADHEERPCPICGADPQHHRQHGITPEQLDDFTAACRAEAEKIQARQADLSGTIAQLNTEQKELKTGLDEIGRRRTETTQAFKSILGPSITTIDGDLSDLSERRAEIAARLSLYEQLRRLDEIDQPPELTPQVKKEKGFALLPPSAYDEFATAVQELLRAWSFPELDRVVYDTAAEDIVISGKARKDDGKGYRAITYAAFMIGLLLETKRKHLSHPGFVLLDSPLVTYREPDEHIGEGVKFAFYRNLAVGLGVAQVIILENEEPSEEVKQSISFTGFTKNQTVGRYGLFPPLPLANEQ